MMKMSDWQPLTFRTTSYSGSPPGSVNVPRDGRYKVRVNISGKPDREFFTTLSKGPTAVGATGRWRVVLTWLRHE